jgi:hypothetical protein
MKNVWATAIAVTYLPLLVALFLVWVIYEASTIVRLFPQPWTRYVYPAAFWDAKVWRKVVGPFYVRIPLAWARRESDRLQRGNA